jgi:hypothetical protein
LGQEQLDEHCGQSKHSAQNAGLPPRRISADAFAGLRRRHVPMTWAGLMHSAFL